MPSFSLLSVLGLDPFLPTEAHEGLETDPSSDMTLPVSEALLAMLLLHERLRYDGRANISPDDRWLPPPPPKGDGELEELIGLPTGLRLLRRNEELLLLLLERELGPCGSGLCDRTGLLAPLLTGLLATVAGADTDPIDMRPHEVGSASAAANKPPRPRCSGSNTAEEELGEDASDDANEENDEQELAFELAVERRRRLTLAPPACRATDDGLLVELRLRGDRDTEGRPLLPRPNVNEGLSARAPRPAASEKERERKGPPRPRDEANVGR